MIDITLTIKKGMKVYRNKQEKQPKFEKAINDYVYETDVEMNLHTGSHIDFPLHMIPGGKTSDDYEIDQFMGNSYVLDCSYVENCITKEDLKAVDIAAYDIILFKTKNSEISEFNPEFIYVSESAARYLALFDLKAVGIDGLGIERSQNGHPTHKALLRSDILIYEGLNLKDVPQGAYEFIGLPTKIGGVEAAPVRAILR